MWSKQQVKQALYHFAAYLISKKSAIVKIIVLPKGEAKGLDDFLIKYGRTKFQNLMNTVPTLTLKDIQETLSGNSKKEIKFPLDIFQAQ